MVGPDGQTGGLLDDQPDGRKGPGGRLLGGGRYRRPSTGEVPLARQLRIAAGRPQAILKITRYGHSGVKIVGHLQYVSRRGALELEDEQGARGHSIKELRRRVRVWCAEAGVDMAHAAPGKRQRRATMHFILDAGQAKPEALTRAARTFLQAQFGKAGHEYFFVRHDDTRQPHVHVVMTMADGRGRRLHTSVRQVQQWREQFAAMARAQGIKVDASRAWERGKAPTRSRGTMRHGAPSPPRWNREQVRRGMEARRYQLMAALRDAEGRGDVQRCEALRKKIAQTYLRVDRELVERVISESRSSDITTPWERLRAENHVAVRQDLLTRATELEQRAQQLPSDDEQRLVVAAASRLRVFEAGLSPSPTRSQQVAAELDRQQRVSRRSVEEPQRDDLDQ